MAPGTRVVGDKIHLKAERAKFSHTGITPSLSLPVEVVRRCPLWSALADWILQRQRPFRM